MNIGTELLNQQQNYQQYLELIEKSNLLQYQGNYSIQDFRNLKSKIEIYDQFYFNSSFYRINLQDKFTHNQNEIILTPITYNCVFKQCLNQHGQNELEFKDLYSVYKNFCHDQFYKCEICGKQKI
ncbi:hypothetical protein PPERSA_07911 [Pseudocohnilembus persalinus]|uniref:Uncharacterized protein n=1 Tax=Pseudocohnilembus persalinus TaxID=266149 RepID=A0A0V0QXR4_PSEPJ|nr:hypothetical protein PPERSA_07911 [Pseudocohnilembus persalinus]|eukprot:KRX06677.1 hypothetical protein PPERSA_07911 [Pseudocohnilembus persalinus]